MTLADLILDELNRLVGLNAPQGRVVSVTDSDGLDLAVDFSAIDSLSCSFRELRLRVPALVGASTDVLEAWAAELSKRVTYLLENIGPVEVDEQAGKVLVRSNPPDQQPDATRFYEVVLATDTSGNFTLRRYQSDKGVPGRKPVDVTCTHEVLHKLVTDLVETIPTP